MNTSYNFRCLGCLCAATTRLLASKCISVTLVEDLALVEHSNQTWPVEAAKGSTVEGIAIKGNAMECIKEVSQRI